MPLLNKIISYWLEGIAAVVAFLGVSFYGWKVSFDKRYKIVVFLLGVVAIFAVQISINTGVTNSMQYSCIYLLNSLCWSSFYYNVLTGRLKRRLAMGIAVVTLSYFIYKNVILDFDLIFDSVGQVLSSLGIVLLVLIFFHQTLSAVKEDSLTQNFDFWISSAQLIYHLGAFGIFLTFDHFTSKILNPEHYTAENRQILTSLWGLHNVLLFLASLIIWLGALWIVYRKKSTSS